MNNQHNKYLWLLLLATLLLAWGGFHLRYSNESNNANVITTVDYREFSKTASLANRDLQTTWRELQRQGVRFAAVGEVTLRDLAYQGDAFISPWGEFISASQLYDQAAWDAARKAVGDSKVSPDKLTVSTRNPQTAAFLDQKLAARFSEDELISFKTPEASYYIINAELAQPPKKQDGTAGELDAPLGFDEKILNQLKDQGFNIILRPAYNTGSNTRYLQEYEQMVKKYGVKYLIFGNTKLTGYPEHLEVMTGLVKKYGLIVGIIETSVQLGYTEQKGLDQVMLDSGYSINRVYSTSNDEFVTSVDERYYRWVRAVIDRGIRILYVLPFKDNKVSYSENLANTINTIGELHQTISAKGFVVDRQLNHLSSQVPGPWQGLMLSLSLLLGGVLYLKYLFRPGRRWVAGILVLGAAACLTANYIVHMDLSKVYALGAAILYPSLSSLLLMHYLRDNPDTPLLHKMVVSLAIILGINALGMYTVVSSLADIRYIMNVKLFSGVKAAFITPLLLLVLNYLTSFPGEQSIMRRLGEAINRPATYLSMLVLIIFAVAMYLYVGRSGHTADVQVSALEVRLREILESIFLARPRFKEIIIGYPSLLAMVYLYHKYRRDIILLILGLGVAVGSISMVNSFCHVFTAISISASRTLAGLLVGGIIGLLVLALIRILEKLLPGLMEE